MTPWRLERKVVLEVQVYMTAIVLTNRKNLLIPILDNVKAKTPRRGAGTYGGDGGVSVNVAIRP